MELEGKRVIIVSGNGFVEPELQYPRYRLQEAGATVTVATMGKNPVKGLYGYPVPLDDVPEEGYLIPKSVWWQRTPPF